MPGSFLKYFPALFKIRGVGSIQYKNDAVSSSKQFAELHIHSDAHIIDGTTVLHNQDRCLLRIVCSLLPNAIISHTSPQVPLAVFAVAARARTRQVCLQPCTPLPASTPQAALPSPLQPHKQHSAHVCYNALQQFADFATISPLHSHFVRYDCRSFRCLSVQRPK